MSETTPMEIERKWLVNGWPVSKFQLLTEQNMRQGYLSLKPSIRIREENTIFSSVSDWKEQDSFILNFKSSGTLARKEIEISLNEAQFCELEDLIGLPLIPKVRRTYLLPDGHHLEVNHVDEGQPGEFWYAEIEFGSVEEAESFNPAAVCLEAYLNHDVTEEPGHTMGAYWKATRMKEA